MNRRRFLGVSALLLSGGCLQANPGGTTSNSSVTAERPTTESGDDCVGGFVVEAQPFTAQEVTVQLSDDERELIAEAVENGTAEVVSYGQAPVAADVFVEYDGAFYETDYSATTTEISAYKMDLSWERGQQAPASATSIDFADLPEADQSALRLAVYGGEEGQLNDAGEEKRDQLPRQSLGMHEFPAPYPNGSESSRLVDRGVVWVSWDDRIYRVEVGDATTTERHTRQYQVDHVADDEAGFREALADDFLIRFEDLPEGEHTIMEQALGKGYEECTPASDELESFQNRLPDEKRLPAPNHRSWFVRFEGEGYLLTISQWVQ